MTKLKMINDYSINDIPDHVREEFLVVLKNVSEAIMPLIKETHPNYMLSALVHVLAMYIHESIKNDEEEIKRAALVCAKNLILNIEFYTKVEILEK